MRKDVLKPLERELIYVLKAYKASSFLEIAEMIGVSRLTILRHIYKLETKGYIKIDRSKLQRTYVKSITIISEGGKIDEKNI